MYRLALLFLLFPLLAQAEDVRVIVEDNYPGIIFHSLESKPIERPCFPYGCGGIEGPFTNPRLRAAEDMPACYYDAQGVLFYIREGKECAPTYIDQNKVRLK